MWKKPFRTYERDNGKLEIYGNNHWIELEYDYPEYVMDDIMNAINKQIPDFSNISKTEQMAIIDTTADSLEFDFESCFMYKGHKYFLSEIMAVHNPVHNPNPPEWMVEFDGYMSDSFFSGILVKFSDDCECVKAYTYVS